MDKYRDIAISILSIFEEFLYEKGIDIPNEDKEGNEEEAILYGSDYYSLEDKIVDILNKSIKPFTVNTEEDK